MSLGIYPSILQAITRGILLFRVAKSIRCNDEEDNDHVLSFQQHISISICDYITVLSLSIPLAVLRPRLCTLRS